MLYYEKRSKKKSVVRRSVISLIFLCKQILLHFCEKLNLKLVQSQTDWR